MPLAPGSPYPPRPRTQGVWAALRHTPLKALKPPSTGTTTPLTKFAPGPQSQSKVLSSSSGLPKRPAGV